MTTTTAMESLRSRVGRWLNKPAAERKLAIRARMQSLLGTPLRFGLSKFECLFLAYHPDSHYIFRAHPEFDDLFKRFTAHNRLNNGGDIARLWSLILNCKQIIEEGIKGDFAELGVWRGNTAAVLVKFASCSDREVFLFDTYQGFSNKDVRGIDADKGMAFDDTSIELVRKVIGNVTTHCHYVKGYFPDSISEIHKSNLYAVVSLDCDLYEPMKSGLAFFYPRMAVGGIFFLHDYSSLHWNGAKLAIDEFCKSSGEYIVLMPDKSGSAFLRKTKSGVPG